MTDLVEVTTIRPDPSQIYSPSGIILYGVPVSPLPVQYIQIVVSAAPLVPNLTVQMALIYGYCFQGHCYTMQEPTLVAIPFTYPNQPYPANGCGWDGNNGYVMWTVDKLDSGIQLQLQGDTFEELILRRNVNRTKQPVSYSQSWAMAHRGGTLTE
jgi:hypothetical protein